MADDAQKMEDLYNEIVDALNVVLAKHKGAPTTNVAATLVIMAGSMMVGAPSADLMSVLEALMRSAGVDLQTNIVGNNGHDA